jgi:putative membrane protein
MMERMMWGGMESWGWGMWAFHNLLWWVILILGIVVLVRLLRGTSMGSETALDILKKRYARGEIDKAEFEQKMRDIGA